MGDLADGYSAERGDQPWVAAKSSPVPTVPAILATPTETEYA